jgi:hypothetical protein
MEEPRMYRPYETCEGLIGGFYLPSNALGGSVSREHWDP